MMANFPRSVSLRLRHISGTASAGYTLVEMLVVLVIISLVLGLVGPRVLAYLGESRVKTAKLQIESFGSALDLFYIDAGRYPTDSEGLAALAERRDLERPLSRAAGCRWTHGDIPTNTAS
jgi:general secretion pathway protein G